MNFNEIFFMMAIFLYVKLFGVKYYQRKVATALARLKGRVQRTMDFKRNLNQNLIG